MVTDADHRFRYVESGVAGSMHDHAVWELSDFGQKISTTDRIGHYFLLGDAG